MDQSYFRFLFRLAPKSKQSGLSKSEKSLAKRNVTTECSYELCAMSSGYERYINKVIIVVIIIKSPVKINYRRLTDSY